MKMATHWLAAVLENVTSGNIQTTARAPRKEDLNVQDVNTTWFLRQTSIAPWTVEFTTLLSSWGGLLPFGFVTAKDASTTLEDINQYSLYFPDYKIKQEVRLRVPHFILVSYNSARFGAAPRNLKSFLLDDEVGYASSRTKYIRTGSVNIVSAFTYVTNTRTASSWMREDVANIFMSAD